MIYRHALEDLRAQYPDKLKVVHALSREPDAESHGPNVYAGRVGAELISKHIEDPTAAEVFACGPALSKWDKLQAKETGEELTPRFMETVVAAIESVGVPKKRLHLESYG